MLIQQQITDVLAQNGISHHDRHDVTGILQMRHADIV
jgi:hypothetical protein